MKQDFFEFMREATTAFGAVAKLEERLQEKGYEKLLETEEWKLKNGDKKYVMRNDSSLIAFEIPNTDFTGFHMVCAHSDSPSFKLKEYPCIVSEGGYLKFNVENYGGMIKETWLDRPLSIAGRIIVRKGKKELETKRIDLKRPICIIPSLAIHMKKAGEQEKDLNTQNHLLPLAGMNLGKDALNELVAAKAGVLPEDILGTDLYLYPVAEPVCMGINEEFIGAARLDDLACVYCGAIAMTEANIKESDKAGVLAVFDNEEVGSASMQGAASDFLKVVLERIAAGVDMDVIKLLAGSFMLSADNAHAMHPNYAEKADPTNRPILNEGIVIKYHAGQKYTTSAASGAYVKLLCENEGIPYQTYQNRSDIAGGSTLGNIALTKVSVPAADIGLPQLAMHSAFETMGTKDMEAMINLMKTFFEA